jgi:molecular chaperone GrpE
MFGRKKNEGPHDPQAPEGQAGYIPIDDAGDLPVEDASDAANNADELLARVRGELDETNDRLRRAMADFQNYQRRALQNEQEARRQAVSQFVGSVVPVVDHFDQALSQKADGPGAERILEGIRVIRAELLRALERNGVSIITPSPNDPFDPMRHEAIMQQAGEGVEPGHISATFQPGFEYGDRVIRSAKVAVAPAE